MVPLLSLMVPGCAHAQSGPELHSEYAFERGVASHTGDADLSSVRVRAGRVGLSTPTPPLRIIEDRWIAVQPVAFDHQWVRYADAPASAVPVDRLDLFRIRVGTLHAWTPSERLTVVGFVEPGLFTDFRGPLGLDDFSVSVIGLVNVDISDSVSAGAGIGWLTSVGRPRLLPLLSTHVERGRITLDLLLPRTGTLDIEVQGPVSVGVGGEFSGGLYRLHDDGRGLPALAYQEVQVLSLGPTLTVSLRERLRIVGAIEWQPYSRLAIVGDRHTELASVNLRPGWSAGLQVQMIVGEAVESEPPETEVPSEAAHPSSTRSSP